jgi:hypothetical protein
MFQVWRFDRVTNKWLEATGREVAYNTHEEADALARERTEFWAKEDVHIQYKVLPLGEDPNEQT